MDPYQFWLLDEADLRVQGLLLACATPQDAWIVADRLLPECRAVEIWRGWDLVGRLGDVPPPIAGAAPFVFPSPPTRRREAAKRAKPATQATSRRRRTAA